jgi:hypothetical protein
MSFMKFSLFHNETEKNKYLNAKKLVGRFESFIENTQRKIDSDA